MEHAKQLPAWADEQKLVSAVNFNQKRGTYLGVLYGFASGMMSTVIPKEARAVYYSKGGADMIKRFMRDEVLSSVQELEPIAKELDLSMAQLAVAWVLQNENVASAIIGASRPEQVHDNAGAAGVTIPAELLSRIDDALGSVVERDPAKTNDSSPKTREA